MTEANESADGRPEKRGRVGRARSALALSKVAPIKRASLSAQVSEVIIEGLLEGRLRPGDRLVENDLVGLLGVSRSPVREALTELASSGVVVREPGRGGRIREWTQKDLQDLFGVRCELEGYAARLAATRASLEYRSRAEKMIARMRKAAPKDDFMAMIELDLEFHQILWELAGNQLLQQVLEGLSQQFRFFLTLNWKFHGGLDDVPNNHEKLLEAVMSGDPKIAEHAMQNHVVVEKMMTAFQQADE